MKAFFKTLSSMFRVLMCVAGYHKRVHLVEPTGDAGYDAFWGGNYLGWRCSYCGTTGGDGPYAMCEEDVSQ